MIRLSTLLRGTHCFSDVNGMSEECGGTYCVIAKGTPFTWDVDEVKGILVIYDELGHAWIAMADQVGQAIHQLIHNYQLQKGAHVPLGRIIEEIARGLKYGT